MNSSLNLASIDRLQSTVDDAARLHRVGLLLFFLACVCVSLPRSGLPAWMPVAGMLTTGMAFLIKAAGTVREIRVAGVLRKVMGMPRRLGASMHGNDANAWKQTRSYIVVSVVLTVAAALMPSMIASSGDSLFAHLTGMLSMAALMIQSFDNPRRLRDRVMLICASRMSTHASDGDVLVA
jgi:hypothetical protein